MPRGTAETQEPNEIPQEGRDTSREVSEESSRIEQAAYEPDVKSKIYYEYTEQFAWFAGLALILLLAEWLLRNRFHIYSLNQSLSLNHLRRQYLSYPNKELK